MRLRTGGSFTKSGALAAMLVLFVAVPVAAEVAVQNFMTAEVTSSDACFTKTAGADANNANGLLTFDAATTVTNGGVDLLQETTTLSAFAGDRLLYSEAVLFNNDCGHDITISFISEDDPAGGPAIEPATGGLWDGVNVSFSFEDPAGATILGLGGTYTEMLRVNTGTLTTGGTFVLGDGASVTMAIVIDTDETLAPNSTGILRWTAVATHS